MGRLPRQHEPVGDGAHGGNSPQQVGAPICGVSSGRCVGHQCEQDAHDRARSQAHGANLSVLRRRARRQHTAGKFHDGGRGSDDGERSQARHHDDAEPDALGPRNCPAQRDGSPNQRRVLRMAEDQCGIAQCCHRGGMPSQVPHGVKRPDGATVLGHQRIDENRKPEGACTDGSHECDDGERACWRRPPCAPPRL
jgi:hypothetical protein